MATLIPSLGSCRFSTQGERRIAERLEQKLDDDYLLWHDVPVGPTNSHPDFVVLHPRRGLLILEVKDWRVGSTILSVDKQTWKILDNGTPKSVINPLEQARHYAHQVINALQRDPQLVQNNGPHQGKLCFPWSYGVVLTNITRKQFNHAQLDSVIEPQRAICSDEMTESVEPEDFQSKLWEMFPYGMRGALSLPQIDRVRWILFPQVRVVAQDNLFGDDEPLPDLMRVMDLQQEQLARSLGDGHRVIHGVAGSGKTMILGYRAEYLSKATVKPILVLCFNKPLAAKLASVMAAKQLGDKVHVRSFHQWCRQQLVTYGQALPSQGDSGNYAFELVERVIRAMERNHIPCGQYAAILIDEGHDFAPEWLKLVVQMVAPETNSLLILCDDAQSIYERSKNRRFSFKQVGIQAKGRTTILKINYRNTRQILEAANLVAHELLTPEDTDDDGIPLIKPVSCGREGEKPLVIRLPNLRAEADKITELLSAAHNEGHAWGDMAVICRHWSTADACAEALRRRKLPLWSQTEGGAFEPGTNTIKVLTMHSSKGLEFPVVALPGIGQMPTPGEDEKAEARLFYVAATRATHKLLITASGDSGFATRLIPATL